MSFYYICDGCGDLVTITDAEIGEDDGWMCDKCGSAALWEFTDKDHAVAHSQHIQRLVNGGLFRRVGA